MFPWSYLCAHLVGAFGVFGMIQGGAWTFVFPLFTFGVIPIVEYFSAPRAENLSEEELASLKGSRVHLILLLSVVILQYVLLCTYLWGVTRGEWSLSEWIGATLTMGIACGSYGINVAHELGHRGDDLSRWSAKALLLSTLYMHFFIEHNRGHHAKVATEEDPASARLNETFYAFWLRSVSGSFLSAWKIEARRLSRKSRSAWSWDNQALRFIVVEALMLIVIGAIGGWAALGSFVCAAVIGFSLLECVNYIEHYGLQRKKTESGRYEQVTPAHSWNADYALGRLFLFELSRHADHHAHPRRAYQQLRHFPESFQLPTGYPGMILIALIPSLYIPLMARHIDRESARVSSLRHLSQNA